MKLAHSSRTRGRHTAVVKGEQPVVIDLGQRLVLAAEPRWPTQPKLAAQSCGTTRRFFPVRRWLRPQQSVVRLSFGRRGI